MRTIRRQLLVGLLGGALFCTLVAGVGTYFKVLEEASRLFDEQLRQLAATVPTHGAPSRAQGVETDVVVQVWNRQGKLSYASAPSQHLPAAPELGYGFVDADDGRWRVFVAMREGERVQVAQAILAREEVAAGLALRSLLPFVLVTPVLGLLIWFVVGNSLRPLRNLAEAVGARSPVALQPLTPDGQPPELLPVVSALNELLRKLDQALSSQRAFVADAAHELRSPLTALKLQLALAERAAGDEQRALSFAKLHERLDRATHVVQQLLTSARQESAAAGRPVARVGLLDLAQQCVADRFVHAEGRGIDLGVAPGGGEAVADGYPDDLRILLGNLIENALRYTPPGGRVDVAVGVGEADGRPFLQVSDTGPGIPPQERERVFDRFYRGEGNDSWGSGLGLSIVRSIADAHGASVTLGGREQGSGLVATVRFPPASTDAAV
ncbi:ATP-binding protein [Massilia terrae]|uniref:histidine kinase n=1 Tax=Massilia terrae TaxID=1811224 RepID=A0ABT2CZD1_9BURK|nr:ATP-binding protein [Massilia terrae]MCS0659343.1 ATP-binding protein [Massilia terrae]